MFLAAIGGCTAVDVDIAAGRHAEPTRFDVTVTGDKVSDDLGNRMTNLQVTFAVTFPDGEERSAREPSCPARSGPPTTVCAP